MLMIWDVSPAIYDDITELSQIPIIIHGLKIIELPVEFLLKTRKQQKEKEIQ